MFTNIISMAMNVRIVSYVRTTNFIVYWNTTREFVDKMN